jgi:Membrane-associated phospholipid phosphatase
MNKGTLGWTAAIVGGALAAAAAAAALPEHGANALDRVVQQWAESMKSGGADAVMKLFSAIGSTAGLIIYTGIITFGVWMRRGWREGAAVFVAVAAGYGLNSLLKGWVGRVRPEEAWGIAADGASFPSVNAMLGMIIFGMLAVSVWRDGAIGRGAKYAIGSLCGAIVLLLGASRLYFQVHYATDIIAGYALGIAIVGAAMLIAGEGGRQETRRMKDAAI